MLIKYFWCNIVFNSIKIFQSNSCGHMVTMVAHHYYINWYIISWNRTERYERNIAGFRFLLLLLYNCFTMLCFCCTVKWSVIHTHTHARARTHVPSLLDLPPTSFFFSMDWLKILSVFFFSFHIFWMKSLWIMHMKILIVDKGERSLKFLLMLQGQWLILK